jgi:predicted ATPase with chaperone activity
MRVARTIADLTGDEKVGPLPMAEAIALRGVGAERPS